MQCAQVKPVGEYLFPDELSAGSGVSFFTIMARAQSLRQLAIGYVCGATTVIDEGHKESEAYDDRGGGGEADDGPVLNPPNKSELKMWKRQDKIIVLAE